MKEITELDKRIEELECHAIENVDEISPLKEEEEINMDTQEKVEKPVFSSISFGCSCNGYCGGNFRYSGCSCNGYCGSNYRKD